MSKCRGPLITLAVCLLLSLHPMHLLAQNEAAEIDDGTILRMAYPAAKGFIDSFAASRSEGQKSDSATDKVTDSEPEGQKSESLLGKFVPSNSKDQKSESFMNKFSGSAPSLRAHLERPAAPRYMPTDALVTPRFSGIRTFARLPYIDGPESASEEGGAFLPGVDAAIVGLPFDTGATFKVGARFGPEAVRSASAILRPHNPEQGVTTFGVLSAVDYGDAPITPGFIEDSLRQIAATLKPLAEAGIVTLGIGGDHSVTLGELRALAAVHGPLALVHFDAHGDLWDSYFGKKYSHGTVFARAVEEGLLQPRKSIQLGLRGPVYGAADVEKATELGFEVVPTWQLLTKAPAALGEMVRARVGDAKAFLSFDVDFFDPAFAPGTGTPEVGGPSTYQGLSFLRSCVGINWVGGDVVEVIPALDPSQITAHAAAQVAYEFLTLVAKQSKEGIVPTQDSLAAQFMKGLTS